jgi:hypothetical protein
MIRESIGPDHAYYRHEAFIPEYHYRFFMRRDFDVMEVKNWCRVEFGPEGEGERWRHHIYAFGFRDEIDAVKFRLRWG